MAPTRFIIYETMRKYGVTAHRELIRRFITDSDCYVSQRTVDRHLSELVKDGTMARFDRGVYGVIGARR